MSSLRFRYQTLEFDNLDIHLRTLRDNQQFIDPDGVAEKLGISSATWPLFGILWDSGNVLAHLMLDYEIEGKRILEVGCGLALASLVLNSRDANITATDYHPEAGGFLEENVRLNSKRAIPFIRTGWADAVSELGQFDLIIGSDLLYEPNHIELLSGFIEQHANPACEVIIVDPCRAQRSRFSKKMVELGYVLDQKKPEDTQYLSQVFKGYILHYQRH